MALMLESLYDALKTAGASEEQARAAARDVAGYDSPLIRIERDVARLKWMVGAVIALQIGTFWTQWQNLNPLTAIETRVANLERGSCAGRGSTGPGREPAHRNRGQLRNAALRALTVRGRLRLTASGTVTTAPGPEE
jgi:hypothetical protein